jgi:putative DNA primase/helicase
MRFDTFAASHGVLLCRSLRHGVIIRCPTEEKPRRKNGAYLWDGSRGWVCNWNQDGEIHWFNDPDAKPWTEAEKRAWHERQAKAAFLHRQKQERAAQNAMNAIQRATHATHPYLAAKGFPERLGLVSETGELLIPINDLNGKVMSLQRIFLENNEWQKKMLVGGKTKGGVFRLGAGNSPVLCEGFATGLSIRKALDMMGMKHRPVLVCFSAGNLVEVSKHFQGSNAIVCADNDVSLTGQKAAEASGLLWITPEEVGLDFNDLHQTAGIVAVVKVLKEGMKR